MTVPSQALPVDTVGSDDAPPASRAAGPDDAGMAYDLLAPRFDQLQQENSVLAQSARVSLDLVSEAMKDRRFLLELGCGTGRETLALAAAGKHVVACDPSRESLSILRGKAAERGLLDRIETHVLSASGIGSLEPVYGAHSFDGIYASFALSYEPDLHIVSSLTWGLLRPRSPMFATIYNRVCLMEIVLFAPFLVPRRGLTRLEGRTRLPVGGRSVTIRSYTRQEIQSIFGRHYTMSGTWGVPALIPPNYLHRLVDRAGSFRSGWMEMDARYNGSWPFRNLGSHTGYLLMARENPDWVPPVPAPSGFHP